jgi:hypothetical protein
MVVAYFVYLISLIIVDLMKTNQVNTLQILILISFIISFNQHYNRRLNHFNLINLSLIHFIFLSISVKFKPSFNYFHFKMKKKILFTLYI